MSPNKSHPRRIGLVLAAGRGRRMGRTKQLVPWPADGGEKPLVAAAYDAIRPVCDDMIVVLGHEAEAVAAALGERAYHRVNSDPDAAMFDSVRAGLQRARKIDAAAAVVLQPGDHPEVSRATLDAILVTAAECPEQVVLPEYQGRGGHPALIPPAVVERLLAADCPQGLGAYWIENSGLCQRLPIGDAGIVRDVDTPEELKGR